MTGGPPVVDPLVLVGALLGMYALWVLLDRHGSRR